MVTIKDVAERSGFSVATVSAVINNLPVVSSKAKDQILQAIDELGYRPNAIARSLKNAKTSTVGIIVRDITNPFYPEVVSGLEEVAWANNYEVFLGNTENDIARERKYIENLVNKRVDGVIICTSHVGREDYYDKLHEHKIPFVFLNRKPDELRENEYFVGANNALASEKVIDLLYKLGYQKISFFCGPQHFSTFRERYEGFLKGMSKHGLPAHEQWLWFGDFTRKTGYQYTMEMIEKKDLPEAVFCSSDLLAFGVYTACKEKGLRIPEDLALISIDNNRFDDLIDLSSVDLQHKSMGRMAMDILINLINKKSVEETQKEILLDPHLVIRKSCGYDFRNVGSK